MSKFKIEREFVRTFGHIPEIIAAAPGRVNLIGEHIDYSDGYVLPFAIADRTYAAIGKRSDNLVRIASAQRRNSISPLKLKRFDLNLRARGNAMF
jgi:galactokinase